MLAWGAYRQLAVSVESKVPYDLAALRAYAEGDSLSGESRNLNVIRPPSK